jgi:3-hydroxyisobutyrate dehydrogenase-like beta-hydroxyacid dehydrogenase
MTTVAFLGTGLMGAALAEAAARRGETVRVWNRTGAKAKALEVFGARAWATPSEAVTGAEHVHIVLSDDAAVDATIHSFIDAVGAGTLVSDHSTTSPSGTASRAARLEARGVAFVHAPVFMTPAMCREAKGMMLAAAPKETFARAEAALRVMTGKLHYLGERRDLAAANKLFGNAMIIAITAGLADVYAIAAALGIEATTAHALFTEFNPAGGVAYRGLAMARGDYRATFELTMARKDLRLMVEAAAGRSLAALPGVAQRMDALVERGLGAEDLGVLSIDAVPAS